MEILKVIYCNVEGCVLEYITGIWDQEFWEDDELYYTCVDPRWAIFNEVL